MKMQTVTPPKTNMDTQNDGLGKVSPVKHGYFGFKIAIFDIYVFDHPQKSTANHPGGLTFIGAQWSTGRNMPSNNGEPRGTLRPFWGLCLFNGAFLRIR